MEKHRLLMRKKIYNIMYSKLYIKISNYVYLASFVLLFGSHIIPMQETLKQNLNIGLFYYYMSCIIFPNLINKFLLKDIIIEKRNEHYFALINAIKKITKIRENSRNYDWKKIGF